MSVLKKIFKESESLGVEKPSEGANLYDKGAQTKTPAPDINVSSVPSYTPSDISITTHTANLPKDAPKEALRDDDHYGFVHESLFKDREAPELPFMGYSEDQAFIQGYEERTNVLDFMGLPEEASDMAKTAAYDSSIHVRDYTAAGELLRSFAAGAGQVLIGFADTIDWFNASTTNLASWSYKKGLQAAGYEGAGADYAAKQLGEFGPTPLAAASIDLGPMLGVDMDISFTGGMRALGEELESWDDKIDMSGIDGQFVEIGEDGGIDVKYGQMLNAKFWYTKVVKQIPNLLTFLIPASAGAKGGQALVKGMGFGKSTIINSNKLTKNLKFFGSKGGGNGSSLIIKGEDVGKWFGGAIGGNFAEGAMLAGQTHREVLENGGTRDQAAMAGWGVMKDNAIWILADGLQYSILTKGLGGIGSRLKMKSGVNFKNAMSDFLIGSGVALTDGKLEEFQEIYQDWRVNKRVAEANDEEYNVSYFDYYFSPEVAETRVVAFAMGFGGASVGITANAFKDGVNMIAERNNLLDEKIESTGLTKDSSGPMVFAKAAEVIKKYGFQNGISTKAEQEIHKREEHILQLAARIIGNGEIKLGKANIQKEIELGRISEKEGNHFIETLDILNESFGKIGFSASSLQKLSSDGKAELVRISNILRHTKDSQASSNEFYEGQIQNWENKRSLPEYKNRQGSIDYQINQIKAEQDTANQAYQADIDGATQAIDEIFTLESEMVQKMAAEKNAKHSKMKAAKELKEEAQRPPVVQKAAPKTEGTKKNFAAASKSFVEQTKDNETLKRVQSIKNKRPVSLKSKKSRLNKNEVLDSVNFFVATGHAVKPLLKHVASKVIAGESLTKEEQQIMTSATSEINDIIRTQRKKEQKVTKAKEKITSREDKKERTSATGQNIVSTKGFKTNLVQKKDIYDTKLIDGERDVRVEVKTMSDGTLQISYKQKEDGRWREFNNENISKERQDLLIESFGSIQGYIDKTFEQKSKFVETITDVNKLYTKKFIEKRGLVNTTPTGTETKPSGQQKLFHGSTGKITDKLTKRPAKRDIVQEKIAMAILRKNGVNMVVADYMFRTDGSKRYYGMAQGLSVFLNANSATQETFFHEFNHIYVNDIWYETNKDGAFKLDKNGNRIVSSVIKDAINFVISQPIFNKKLSSSVYINQILFKNTDGTRFTLNDLIMSGDIQSFEVWKKETKAKDKTINGYKEHIKREAKKLGHTLLPSKEQRIILEECIVDLMSKTQIQETNGDVLKKDDKKRDSLLIRMWSKAKKPFTKKESKTILETTGNTDLSKMDNPIKALVEDSKSSNPKYNLRKDRGIGAEGKLFHAEDQTSTELNEELSKEVLDNLNVFEKESKLEEKLQGPLYRNEKGMLTAAGRRAKLAFLNEKTKKIDEVITELYPEGSTESKHYNENKTEILNMAFTSFAYSGQEQSVNEQEEDLQDNEYNLYDYDNRNGYNEKIGSDISSYIKLGEEIQGIPVTHGQIKSALYNTIWKYRRSAKGFEEEINSNIDIIRTVNPKKLSEWLTRKEELLARYFIYMNEVYGLEGRSLMSPVLDYHHDFSSYKRINFHNIYLRKNKKGEFVTSISKTFGVDSSIMNTDMNKKFGDKVKVDKPKDDKMLSKQEVSKLKFLSSIISLRDSLKEFSGNKKKQRRVIEEFVMVNFVGEQYKDDISLGLLEDGFIDQFLEKNKETGKTLVDQLIEDHGMVEVYKYNGKRAGWLGEKGFVLGNKDTDGFIKQSTVVWRSWKNSPKIQQAIDSGILTKQDVNNVGSLISEFGKRKNIDKKKQARIFLSPNEIQMHKDAKLKYPNHYDARNIIINYLSAELALGDFSSQILTPEGKKKNFISKRHQMDVLIEEDLPNMSDGQIKDLYGDNLYTDNYINNRDEGIELAQINGAVIEETGIDSGNETANQKTLLEAGLVAQAISGKKKTYSQSVSIIADKDINIHITNTNLLSLEQARIEAKKISDKDPRFSDGSSYLNFGGKSIFNKSSLNTQIKALERIIKKYSKDPVLRNMVGNTAALEQIILNNTINKYYAQDLLIGKTDYFENQSDYVKRAAGSVAMGVVEGNRIEPLMLKDENFKIKDAEGNIREVNRTDAPSFILPSAAKLISQSYGGRREVGNHYKFVYYGQNLDNNTFANEVGKRHPFYLKSNTFVLSKSFLKNNPNLIVVKNALEAREKKISPGTIPIAAFSSALKVQSSRFKNNLISINDLSKLNEADLNSRQDALFKDNETYGLDGKYLRLQTELDKNRDNAIIGKQTSFNLLSNPKTFSQAIEVLKALELFSEKQMEKFSGFMSPDGKVNLKAIDDLRKELIKEADVDIYGESTLALLKDGSYDSGSVEILRDKITSVIKKRLLRVRTPKGAGTVGYQTTDFGFGEMITKGDISQSTGLQSYFDKEGNPRVDDNGNLEPAKVALDKKLGFKVGDKIILTRIPNSKMGDNIIGIVTSVYSGTGSVVQIPADLSDIIGSDMDGDSLHITGLDKSKEPNVEYNDFFEKLFTFLSLKDNIPYMQQAVDFKGAADKAEAALNEVGMSPIESSYTNLSFIGDNLKYRSNIMGKGNIGTSASINSFHKILSSHNISVEKLDLKIGDDVLQNNYKDKGDTWISLSNILNIFLDEANKGRGARLNMNSVTVGPFTELIMRGVSFNNAVILINSKFMKDAVAEYQNEGTSLNRFIKDSIAKEMGFDNYTDLSYQIDIDIETANDYTLYRDFTKRINTITNIDINKVKDGTQDKSIRNLFHSFNRYKSPSWTLRRLTNLENNMPQTGVEQRELFNDTLDMLLPTTFSREGARIIGAQKLNVDGLIKARNKTMSFRNKLEQMIQNGEYIKFIESLEITNPVLKRNIKALAIQTKIFESMDPAYSQGYGNIFNEWSFPEEQKLEKIKKVESLIRSWRLAQEGVYQFNLNAMPRVMQDSQAFIESIGSMASIKTILKQDLDSIELGNYPFIKKYFKIQESKEASIIKKKDLGKPSSGVKVSVVGGEYQFNATNLTRTPSSNKTLNPTKALRDANPKQVEKEFNSLPQHVQDYLLLYDLVMNNHRGPAAILPYLGNHAKNISKKSQSNVRTKKPNFLSNAYKNEINSFIGFNFERTSIVPLHQMYNGKITMDGDNLIVEKGLSDIPTGSIKAISVNIGKNSIETLYKVKQLENGSTVLMPIEASFTHDSLMPSKSDLQESNPDVENIVPTEKISVSVEQEIANLEENGYVYSHTDYSTGNKIYVKKEKNNYKAKAVINGVKIVDHDGKFGSKFMYMAKEETEQFSSSDELGFQEYVNRVNERDMPLNDIHPSDKKRYLDEYNKYKEDLKTVKKLTNKHLKKNEFSRMAIESSSYSIQDLHEIIKETNTLDSLARNDFRNTVLRVMAGKVALEHINEKISDAKKNNLGEKVISELEAGKKQFTTPGTYRSDVSWGNLWLNPDISTAERAEIAALLNELNRQDMQYQKDINKLLDKMNKPHKALLKKKLGTLKYLLYRFSPRFIRHFFNNRLYENIVYHEEYIKDGVYRRELKLVDPKKIEKLYEEGKILKEEYEYHKMYVEVTEMLRKHNNQKIGEDGRPVLNIKKKRKDFIPHITASNLEMAITRNLTAAYIVSNYSRRLKDVYVKDENGVDRKLGDIINEYMIEQAVEGRTGDRVRRGKVKRMIKQANQRVKSGFDSLGNPIILPEDVDGVANTDALGKMGERKQSDEFRGSMSIHDSLIAHTTRSVFKWGLDSQKGYSFKGIIESIPLIDGVISYNSFKNNPQAARWVKELLKDRYARKKGRKSLLGKDGKRHWSDNVFDALHKWTMFIGLGLNFTAAVGNIAIGKYNAYRSLGWTNWRLGEKRYFGFGIKGFNKENADKSRYITRYFGLISDAKAQVTEDMFSGGFGDLVFAFMMGSEKYIQRTQFVGQISKKQWESFEVVDGEIRVIPGKEADFRSLENQADEMKQRVYETQGRGYTDLDQRLVQSYSIIHGLLQFKRWLPTFIMDRLSQEKVLRSGRGYIGSWRATAEFMKDVVYDKRSGADIRTWRKEFDNLPPHRREAVQRAYRGVLGMVMISGLIAMAGGFSDDDDESAIVGQLKKTFWDMNLMINVDKWEYLMAPPSLQTGMNMVYATKQVLSGAEYQRKARYGDPGQSKARGTIARLFPKPLREAFVKN